jgi:hypothetical protein
MSGQVLPGRFAQRARPIKRKLSAFEKSSLLTTQGRALILPGDINTEVEELTSAGYNPCLIFGCENEEPTYRYLLNHYHDSVHLFHMDVFEWMRRVRATGQYSYLHLDLCGHFGREEAINIQAWRALLAPTARVRVSVFRGRRSPMQFEWEEQLLQDLLLRWCELGYELDALDPERWIAFYDHSRETRDDTTKTILAVMISNFFFGLDDFRVYVDSCTAREDFLPRVEGDHLLTNISRWTYNEQGNPSHMFTVWADLVPLPADPLRDSTQWILDHLATMFESFHHHVPRFKISIT